MLWDGNFGDFCLSKKRVNGEKKIEGGRGCTNTSINISWPFLELSKAGQRFEVFLGFFALFVFFFLTLHSLLNVFITTCIASIISSIFQNILIYEIFQFFIVPKVACKPIELPFESESSKTKIKHYTKISISNVYYDFHQIHIIIYADFELIVCRTG